MSTYSNPISEIASITLLFMASLKWDVGMGIILSLVLMAVSIWKYLGKGKWASGVDAKQSLKRLAIASESAYWMVDLLEKTEGCTSIEYRFRGGFWVKAYGNLDDIGNAIEYFKGSEENKLGLVGYRMEAIKNNYSTIIKIDKA